jgi:hypothetical protein
MHITRINIIYIILIIVVLWCSYYLFMNTSDIFNDTTEHLTQDNTIDITKQIKDLVDLINNATMEYIYNEERFTFNYNINIIIDKDIIVFKPDFSYIDSYDNIDLSGTPVPGPIKIYYDDKQEKYFLTKYIIFPNKVKLVRNIDITQNIQNIQLTLKQYKLIFLPAAIKIENAKIQFKLNQDKSMSYFI